MSDWGRDPASGTLIITNKEAIDEARRAKQNRKNAREEIDTLKNEVGEIKALLNKLIEKL